MNIITGYTGTPHITSAQDRAIHQGAFGIDSYILKVGQELEAEIVTANEIRIKDGILVHQGCAANIEQGSYDTLEISNSSQGMFRTDLIVARYTKDAGTNVEAVELVVIEGTAAVSDPTTPSYNEGDIQAGDSPVDMPLYQVNIDGVAIDSVDLLADKVSGLASLAADLQTATAVESGSGSVENVYSTFVYNWTRIGKVVQVSFSTTMKQAVTSSTGTIDVPDLPSPIYGQYAATSANTGGTQPGPARLIVGPQVQFIAYGSRANGTTYYGVFMYLTA